MKILVVNWQDLRHPLAGGAEVHLQEVFSRIARMGHDVVVYCSSFPGAPRQEVIDGLRILREGGRYFFNFRFLYSYLFRFRRQGFDIVVDDMNKIPFFTPLYVRRPIYGIMHHLFGRSIFHEAPAPVAAYVYLMERAAVALYVRARTPFIAVSPSTRDELLRRGFRSDTVSVVHLAVDHALHRPTGVPRSPVPTIGYFGRLKKYKCIDHLLHAVPAARRAVPQLRVVIVGDGDDRRRLERIAVDLGLRDAVEFTGFVPPERKVDLLQQVWFGVTASAKEGWGLTVLEANACGTPVIASNVPGLRDAVRDGETGLLYAFGDTGELARKIVLLAGDADLRRRLSAGALAWSGRFTWEHAARQTITLLEHRAREGR